MCLASTTVTMLSSAARAHLVVHEEGLRHRRRVGEARGLDDDAVDSPALHQPADDADQVAAHGAADAAVVHLEHLLVRVDDEVVVDADLPELVHHHGVLLPVGLGKDAVEQRGLARPKVAGEDGDGRAGGRRRGGHGRSLGDGRRPAGSVAGRARGRDA